MKHLSFQNMAAKAVIVLGRSSKIKLRFSGDTAFITPHMLINLPVMPAGTILTSHQADVWRGYLDHEVGHAVHSDLRIMAGMKEFQPFEINQTSNKIERNKDYDPVLTMLWNVLEDVWEENQQIQVLPGTRRTLTCLCRFIDDEATRKWALPDTDPITWMDMVLAAFYREAWKHRGYPAQTIAGDMTLEHLLGDSRIQEMMDHEMPEMECSQDNLDLARAIKELLEEASEDFTPPNQRGDGAPEDQEDGDEGGAQKPGAPGPGMPGAGGAPGDGPMEIGDLTDSALEMMNLVRDMAYAALTDKIRQTNLAEQARGKKALGEKGDDGSQYAAKGSLPSSPGEDADVDPNGDASVSDHEAMRDGHTFFPAATTERDRIFVPSGENMARYQKERRELASDISAAKKALNIFLRAQTHSAWENGLLEGEHLDYDSLTDHVISGDNRVRRTRRIRSLVDTDILLLLDLSGSMDSELVRQAGITIAEALASIKKARVQIAGFTTGHYHTRAPGGTGVGRTASLQIPLFKAFDEPYKRCQARLGAIETDECTPLGEAYAYGYEALIMRRAPRRVLWVVTDGSPFYPHGDYEHSDTALSREIHQKARAAGIDTMALGIGEQGMKPYVDRHGYIDEISQLTPAIIAMTKMALVR